MIPIQGELPLIDQTLLSSQLFLQQHVLQSWKTGQKQFIPPNLQRVFPSGGKIHVVTNEASEPELLVVTNSTNAWVVVMGEQPTQFVPVLTSDQLRLTLLNEETLENQLFKDYTAPWAGCIMELLLLELKISVDFAYRRRCLRYLRLLSNEHGVLPPSLMIRNVVKHGDFPAAAGGFADVWKGQWDGRDVCLKVIRFYSAQSNRKRTLKQFCREALVWKLLDHPNILPLLGVSTELSTPGFCLISPWMFHGNVLDFLEENPTHDRLSVLLDVAHGIQYLHEYDPMIVHGDIRGANILVNEQGSCSLGDFGLASLAESSSFGTSSNSNGGCVRWMAPEVLLPDDNEDRRQRPSRDIYSFACTALEILTGKPPFHWLTPEVAVIPRIISGSRPPRPSELSCDSLWALIQSCWAQDALLRPLASEVVELIQSALSGPPESSPDTQSVSSDYYTPQSQASGSDLTDDDSSEDSPDYPLPALPGPTQRRNTNTEGRRFRLQTSDFPTLPTLDSLDSPFFESDASDSPRLSSPERPAVTIRRHSDTMRDGPIRCRPRSVSLPAYPRKLAESFPFIYRLDRLQFGDGPLPSRATESSNFSSDSRLRASAAHHPDFIQEEQIGQSIPCVQRRRGGLDFIPISPTAVCDTSESELDPQLVSSGVAKLAKDSLQTGCLLLEASVRKSIPKQDARLDAIDLDVLPSLLSFEDLQSGHF